MANRDAIAAENVSGQHVADFDVDQSTLLRQSWRCGKADRDNACGDYGLYSCEHVLLLHLSWASIRPLNAVQDTCLF